MWYNREIHNEGIGICVGSIDRIEGMDLDELCKTHIFVGEKASWVKIPEGEVQWPGHTTDFQNRIDEFRMSRDEGGDKGKCNYVD